MRQYAPSPSLWSSGVEMPLSHPGMRGGYYRGDPGVPMILEQRMNTGKAKDQEEEKPPRRNAPISLIVPGFSAFGSCARGSGAMGCGCRAFLGVVEWEVEILLEWGVCCGGIVPWLWKESRR